VESSERALLMRLPRYQQIAADLRRRIEDGEFAPGQPLPSETALIAEYGVSRITARHAVAALRAAGLVVTEHGRASRVSDFGDARLELAVALTFDPAGDTFSTWDGDGWADVEEPSRFRTEAGPQAAALGLAAGEPVFVLERQLMHHGGTQVMHRVYVPFATAADVPALEDDPFRAPGELYGLLRAAGHELAWRDVVRAAMPSPDEAATLDVPDGVPLLTHVRTCLSGARQLTVEELRAPAHRVVISSPPPQPFAADD
jgi:GntR family transcriptional regulator